MAKSPKDNRDIVLNRVSAVLRQHIGPDRRFSEGMAARETGMSPRTVRSHRAGENLPQLDDFIAYAQLIGPELVNDVFDLIGLRGAVSLSWSEGRELHVLKEVTEAAAALAAALADGQIDHTEVPVLIREFRDAVRAMDSWIVGKMGGLQ